MVTIKRVPGPMPRKVLPNANVRQPFLRRHLHPRREQMADSYPKPPKRPMSAFTIYIQYYLRQYNRSMRRLHDGRAVMNVLRQEFVELDDESREYFQELAQETKDRYKKEVALWKQQFRAQGYKEIPRIRKRVKQDPDLPRRPMTPYLHYFKYVMPQFQRKYPTMRYKPDLLRLIGKHWRQMPKADKKPFQDRAREGLAAYKTILRQVKQAKKQQAIIRRMENKERKLKKLCAANYPKREKSMNVKMTIVQQPEEKQEEQPNFFEPSD